MNAAEVSAAIVAGTSVLGMVVSMAALAYRVGRLVGTVTALITQSAANDARIEADVVSLDADVKRHLAWHGGNRHRP
jgi:hypothetical protein